MNILIPHTWLLEHLETDASPEDIQRLLSLSGPSVERIEEIEGEPVYDIEVTTNRVDSMSVRGIAREAAVILTQAGIKSRLKPLTTKPLDLTQDEKLELPKIVNDPKLCKRVLCQVISNIELKPSPDWMQKRLRQIGVNVHDIVIDMTNYVTHELGYPCHAFDYDKVMQLGGTIIVKQAEAGKKFTIIDGTEFETVGGEIVFENDKGEIIDLPAIKGTANTSMNERSQNVLFWMENLDSQKVRFGSMTHAIRTVAAQLSEKNLDPHLADDVMNKGVELLEQLAGGKIASERYDEFPGDELLQSIEVPLSTVKQYLGIEMKLEKIVRILNSLGCEVNSDSTSHSTLITVVPPSFRPDLTIPADIVEEIARIYGYHNLPSELMTGQIPTQKSNDNFEAEYMVKELWSALGANEIYSYSLISEDQASLESLFVNQEEDLPKTHVKLKNPLTEDMVYLRRSLWSQHLEILSRNPLQEDLTIFELANVYIPAELGRDVDWEQRQQSQSKEKDSKILPFEELHLTLTTRGDQRYAKGLVEELVKKFHMDSVRYVRTEKQDKVQIFSGEILIGQMITMNHSDITVFDMDWKTIRNNLRAYPTVKPIQKFTPITEDLTFTIPENQQIQRVMESIEMIEHVEIVTLKDLFKRNATFTLNLYNQDKQLDAEDAGKIRNQIVKTVEEKHGAKLVGELK